MGIDKLNDSEILARLIYRAYIAPDPQAPLEAEALLPFQAALDLYARTVNQSETTTLLQNALLHVPAETCETCGDACPIVFPKPDVPDSDREPKPPAADPPDTHTHTHTEARTDDGGELTPRIFAGKGSGEKREIYARLMAFCAAHGLGARRKIAETSNGALTLSDVQNMTDAVPTPLRKWRAAAEAMDRFEDNT